MDYAASPAAPTLIPTHSRETPSTIMSILVLPAYCSDDDLQARVCQLLREESDPGGQDLVDCYLHADDKPPITPESLTELDMPRIINNPKLRHDVNFDRELHFRPNLDGSKGRQKIHQTSRYWRAQEAGLFVHTLALRRKLEFPDNAKNEAYWTRISNAALFRLPQIFIAIRDVLKTLVPDYDQKVVKERLDVDHIMQEIRNGVCDLIDLANWLSKILKNHCAPMRDAIVDDMREEITEGATQDDQEKLVSGLRKLMNILEAMKLDVANHQIRHMRPLLIDDTVNFQRRYNAHRMSIGKLSHAEARNWITLNTQPMGCEPTHLRALTRGLIMDVIYNDTATFCPPTFYLDADRLRCMRTELHTRIYHVICRDVLMEIMETADRNVLRREWASLKACDTLTISVAAIVGAQGKFADKIENIAAEIVRVLCDAEGRSPHDADLISVAEHKLHASLRQDCPVFREHAMDLADRLIPKVQASVHDHSKLSAIDLQDMLVPQVASQKHSSMGFGAHCEPVPATVTPFADDLDADLIRRFTHIIALHWQVWSTLVYLPEMPEKDGDSASDNGSDSTMMQSRTGSPTVPIATAVYAPGRKWLPVSVTVTDVPAGLPTPSPSPKPEETNPPNNGEQNDESLDAKHRQPA